MTLTEASYSLGEALAGSISPSPPMRTGSVISSRSALVIARSVIACMRASVIARSNGSNNSAISQMSSRNTSIGFVAQM